MARKPKNQQRSYEFKSVNFSLKQQTHYQSWVENRTGVLIDVLTNLCDNGVKFTISFDNQQQCYISSCTFKAENLPCSNQIFMLRHSDPEKLIYITDYYVTKVLDFGNA